MIRISLIVSVYFIATSALAKDYTSEKKNSQVMVSIVKTKSGSELTFKTIPKIVEGVPMVINDQKNAPWSLKIKEAKGIQFSNKTLGRKDFSLKTPGFKISAKHTNKPWSFTYKMRVFVCTKNKDKCFTEMHKGQVKS